MTGFPHSIDIIPGVLLFAVSDLMDELTTRRIASTVRLLDDENEIGIRDIVPSYGSILVTYDQSILCTDKIVNRLQKAWEHTFDKPSEAPAGIVTIDVVYGDNCGEDLTNVSEHSGINVEDVITLHASSTYTVGAVGFVPGFTYLIGLDPLLATPRRATPRLRVPAGSVGIGGDQTGVYALPSAGGWNLIGRSPDRLFDPAADPPVRLQLGDRVRFQPVATADFSHLEPAFGTACGDGPIEVLAPGMQSTIQDLGRYGMARYGFAIDGAVDRASLVRANRLVGNSDAAAGLEITLQGPALRFHRRLQLALSGADLGARLNDRLVPVNRLFETMPGDTLTFHRPPASSGARAYLAVRGGFDVPLVMGSASTNLVAGIGGWQGRALLRDDRLPVGQQCVQPVPFAPGMDTTSPSLMHDAPFRVMPGVQRDRFNDATWERLVSETFSISDEANRVGIRLLGSSLAPENGADILSEGVATGSIQVTGEGQAIVMLPGHATIGGYTKIATVVPGDWDRLGQLSPGDTIRFQEFSQDQRR